MKRQLDETEKRAVQKAISSLKEDIERYQFILAEADVNLNQGCKIRYMLDMGNYRKRKRDASAALLEAQVEMNHLSDQLQNGVTVKDAGKEES